MRKEKRQFYHLLSAVCLFFSTNEINKSVDNNDFNSANASVRVILCAISENAMMLSF